MRQLGVMKRRFSLILILFLFCFSSGSAFAETEDQGMIKDLLILGNAILVLRDNGTVIPVSTNDAEADSADFSVNMELRYWFSNKTLESLRDWTDICALARCSGMIVGLKSDGTVDVAWETTFDSADEEMQYNWRYQAAQQILTWDNISSVVSGYHMISAIKTDGSVVITGQEPFYNEGLFEKVSNWKNVIALEQGAWIGEYVYGLDSEGKLLWYGQDHPDEYVKVPDKMNQLVSIHCNRGPLFGVRKDGTVSAWDAFFSEEMQTIQAWKNIKQIAGEDGFVVGLTGDGKVVIAGDPDDESEALYSEMKALENVERLETQDRCCVFYLRDGSVRIGASANYLLEAVEEVNEWRDIRKLYVFCDEIIVYIIGLNNNGDIISEGIDFETQYHASMTGIR